MIYMMYIIDSRSNRAPYQLIRNWFVSQRVSLFSYGCYDENGQWSVKMAGVPLSKAPDIRNSP